MKNTLIPKNRLEKSRSEMLVPKIFPRTKESADILMEASRLWSGLDRFRRDARRYREYTFGNQWGDKILNPNATSEEDKYTICLKADNGDSFCTVEFRTK